MATQDARIQGPTDHTGRVDPARTDIELSGSGTWRGAIADDDLRRIYPDVDFDDDRWEPVSVPGHWRSVPAFAASDGPILYRHHFDDPGTFGPGAERAHDADEPRRTWLALDGIFYTSDVWLDGSYLGDTEGYFFPHSFEITDLVSTHVDHVLALEVSCRPETDLLAKRNLTGVFQHGNMIDPTWNPGGIWRPVRLEQTGAVRITHFRALCRDATAEHATIFVRAVLDTIEARTVELVTRLVPCGPGSGVASPRAGEPIETRHPHPLAAGENRVEWTVAVPAPELWWPHTLGDQPLYELTVEVLVHGAGEEGDRPELVSDRRVRRIGLRSVSMRDWIFSVNGQRLYLKGSNQGPTAMAIAGATADDFERDVLLAKEANLDFLRVHAHIAPPGLYDAADEAGLLLWQDMPLKWAYHRSVRKQARRQAREMVDALAHHPSIILWCGHNEPMAIEGEPLLITEPAARRRALAHSIAEQLLPSWNKSVLDHTIKGVIDKTDGSRPSVSHSGVFPHPPQFDGSDTHLYFGWYHDTEAELATLLKAWPRLARFVSEFGAQAVPVDASFLEPDRWPDLDWERAEKRMELQKRFIDRAVPPDAFDTFEEWQHATQTYQAALIKHHVETLRRLKYRPGGGFAQFDLADAYPAVRYSVLGHDRQRKAGFHALRAACAPVIVVADHPPRTVHPGDALSLDVHVVNDEPIDHHDTIVTAHLYYEEDAHGGGPPQPAPIDLGTEPRPAPIARWQWQGDIAADSCTYVGTIVTEVADRSGRAVLELELRSSERHATNSYSSTVTMRT